MPLSTSRTQPARELFHGYSPPIGGYDEYFTANGELRSGVQPIVHSIQEMSGDEFQVLVDQARNQIQENELIYRGYDQAEGANTRVRQFDPLPLIITEFEWEKISFGLKQRAALLNLVLSDIYGHHLLIHDGIVPPELIYEHPEYLRSSYGAPLKTNQFLPLYAVDLARSPSGAWWVLADHTESPAGLGYALENRLASARMLPYPFGNHGVGRLATFFAQLREMLRKLSSRENPRIVFLNEGAESENYFEDAYLARYLGFALVEPHDLTVRDGNLMIKTLNGLLPIDVALRHIHGTSSDPLEIDSVSRSGVVGLVRAMMQGQLALVNPLGSGLIEAQAFMAYMPMLSQYFLGEDLAIPGVSTWWCGNHKSKAFVLRNLDHLTLRRVSRRKESRGQATEIASRSNLTASIEAEPELYLAQEQFERSTIPVWGSAYPAYLTVRAFVVSTGDSYEVMPGAFAFTADAAIDASNSRTNRGFCKDTWIIRDFPSTVVKLEPSVIPVQIRRNHPATILSRHANEICLLGRMLERAESISRVLRCLTRQIVRDLGDVNGPEVRMLVQFLKDRNQLPGSFDGMEGNGGVSAIVNALMSTAFESSQPTSLFAMVNAIIQMDSIVRDPLALDSSRSILRLREHLKRPRHLRPTVASLQTIFDDLIADLAALKGSISESIQLSTLWRFFEVGQRIERSVQVLDFALYCARVLKKESKAVLEVLLDVFESLKTYRLRYQTDLRKEPVFDLLLLDASYPRSLAFQLERIYDHMDAIPKSLGYAVTALSRDVNLANTIRHQIMHADTNAWFVDGNETGQLTDTMSTWVCQIQTLSELFNAEYSLVSRPN